MIAVWAVVLVCSLAGSLGKRITIEESILQNEVQAWKDAGQPAFLEFPGQDGQPVNVSMLQWGTTTDRFYFMPDYKTAVRFHAFSKGTNASKEVGTQLKTDPTREDLLAAGLQPTRFTKIMIHGFMNNIRSPAIQKIKDAYLHQQTELNVIGVDWGDLCYLPLYLTARSRIGRVAERVADFVDILVQQGVADPKKIHILGHSLGAHIAGLTAKKIKAGKPKRVTGLDPAGPFFWVTQPEYRLNATDGEVVDVVHTNAGVLGYKSKLGMVDFYPNGGKSQPGCGDFAGIGTCSHGRSFDYYAETIREGSGFEGVFCGSDEAAALNMACDGTEVLASMGEQLHFKAEGSYLVKTADSYPYNRQEYSFGRVRT